WWAAFLADWPWERLLPLTARRALCFKQPNSLLKWMWTAWKRCWSFKRLKVSRRTRRSHDLAPSRNHSHEKVFGVHRAHIAARAGPDHLASARRHLGYQAGPRARLRRAHRRAGRGTGGSDGRLGDR